MNTEHTWSGPERLTPDQQRVFEALLAYCLPPGTPFTCAHPPAGATVVRYQPPPGASPRETAVRFEEAHARARSETEPPPKAVFTLDSAPGRHRAGGGSAWVGPGLRVTGPGPARLVRALDTVFLGLALEAGAAEHTVPHLVSWETIARAGYARNLPQHLTVCQTVGPDLASLDRFARSAAPGSPDLVPAGVVLAPAVCMNLFAALADRTLPETAVLTARGMCGRYEAGAARTATRLWSFDMREIVLVGDGAAVRAFRDAMVDAVTGLARRLGLPCALTAANDPFFTSERGDLLGYQSTFALKHELRGRLADASTVAVTSVNLHHRHFGAQFGITLADGTPASSACVGFGLDRWAEWVRDHLGDDPEHWPDFLREAARPTSAAAEGGRP